MNPPCDAQRLGALFINQYQAGEDPDYAIVDELCGTAISSKNSAPASALSSLYGRIIEGLCDDFSTAGVRTCNEVLIRILKHVRQSARGEAMDRLLRGEGLHDGGDILKRFTRVKRTKKVPESRRLEVKKCIIPTRVTIGADIVITSVLLQRLLRFFPLCDVLLIGPPHLDEIFHDIPRVRTIALSYNRSGDIFDRTTPWCDLFATVMEERRGGGGAEVMVFDPDSRLTQLGLLPLAPTADTRLFCSRLDASAKVSLSTLANLWSDKIVGKDEHCPPLVSLPREHRERAENFRGRVKKKNVHLIVMNFGVGNDERKRVPPPFEETLLHAVSQEKKSLVLLDSGSTEEGQVRVMDLLRRLSALSIPTEFLTEKNLLSWRGDISHGVIGFRGSLGAIGALIEKADCFFGYDSCCQHVAAALGTPAVTAFAGHPHRRFLNRWRPAAEETTRIVEVLKNESRSPRDIENITNRVWDAIRIMRRL